MPISRRTVLKGLGASGASRSSVQPPMPARMRRSSIAGRPVELAVTPIGDRIIRVSVVPLEDGRPGRSRPTDRWSGKTGARRSSA